MSKKGRNKLKTKMNKDFTFISPKYERRYRRERILFELGISVLVVISIMAGLNY